MGGLGEIMEEFSKQCTKHRAILGHKVPHQGKTPWTIQERA